ncbi:MAG: HEAT repeat domain-containing protein [Planctomycetota bacterium]|nr:HEAT repeat domain-containing protein [Planctomycetota bacterium]
MPGAKSLGIALFLAVCLMSARAESAERMTFRNNLIPGHMTKHRISRVIRRTTRLPTHQETVSYSRRSEWVQCNVDEDKPGNVKVFQMMADRPPKVLRVYHGKELIKPTPDASRYNLISGSPSLYSAMRTPRDATVEVLPITEPPEQAVLAAMLDIAHWPRKRIDVGHRWQRSVDYAGFSGTQTFEFKELGRIGGQVTGQLTLFVEGEFVGSLGREYTFEKAQAVIYWSRLEQTLVKMEGQATYVRDQGSRKDEYELKLDVELAGEKLLSEGRQAVNVKQLNAIAGAVTDLASGDKQAAYYACRAFHDRWPESDWMPAVESIERRATHRKKTAKRLSPRQFAKLLRKSTVAWRAALENEDFDLLSRTRLALQAAADDYRSRLRKIMKSKDDADRGRAVFAIAFSSRPADLALVEKGVEDSSSIVRALALTGLAARRSPMTDPQILLAALRDEDNLVRRRACDAVAACIPREHSQIVAFVQGVTRLVKSDETAIVRRVAVRALAAIGSRADIDVLQRALESESDDAVRKELQRAIKSLTGRE